MREFTTSVKTKQQADKLPDVPFKLDGVEMVARGPKDSQLAYLIAASSASRTEADQVAAILDFFEQVLDRKSLTLFKKRLLDPEDEFDFTAAMPIFEGLIEEWSGRPTGSASA